MAELSKSEKYDMLVNHVTGIERPTGSPTYIIAADLILKSFVDDVALANKKIAPKIKNIACFQDDKTTEINFGKDNKQSPYKELLEIISMRENEIIDDFNRHIKLADLPEINYYVGRLADLQEMYEIFLSKHRQFISKEVENEKNVKLVKQE